MNVLLTQSIRRQVALATGLLLLPFVVGALWSSTRMRSEASAELGRSAVAFAAMSAASLDQSLRGLDSVATALALNPSVMAMQRSECDRLFSAILREEPLLLNVVLRAPDGSVRGAGRSTADARPPAEKPIAGETGAGGRPVMSDLSADPVTQKPTILIDYPVRLSPANRSMAAVLTLALDLVGLESAFRGMGLPDGSVVTLSNRSGLVLARSRDADRFIGTTVEVPDAAPPGAEPRTATHTDVDGVERIAGSAVVQRGPWTISVGIPTGVIGDRLWPLRRRNLTIAATATLTSLAVWLRVGHRLSHELHRLREAAHRIARGDLSPVDPGDALNKELSQLQSAFGAMAEKLRETRTALDRQIGQERKTRPALEALQRQAVRQERLAAVGLLVSGVAHEVNNPLQAIVGAAELIERQRGLSDDSLKEIAVVKAQSRRASEVIRKLSRFSTHCAVPPEVVDLREVVTEVVQLRRADLDSAKISCETEFAATGAVFVDVTEIEQAVLNFLINAEQAIGSSGVENGRILIRSSDVGARVRLEVLDNGPGVAAGDEAKLFQPFFTTRPSGQGTGLGLSVSYGIIDSYGGTVGYHGSEWGGAAFYFELPRAELS